MALAVERDCGMPRNRRNHWFGWGNRSVPGLLPAGGRQSLPLLCTDRPGVNRDAIHEKTRAMAVPILRHSTEDAGVRRGSGASSLILTSRGAGRSPLVNVRRLGFSGPLSGPLTRLFQCPSPPSLTTSRASPPGFPPAHPLRGSGTPSPPFVRSRPNAATPKRRGPFQSVARHLRARALGSSDAARPSELDDARDGHAARKLGDLKREHRGPYAGCWWQRRSVGESRRRHCPLHVPFWQLSHGDGFLPLGLDWAADLADHDRGGPD